MYIANSLNSKVVLRLRFKADVAMVFNHHNLVSKRKFQYYSITLKDTLPGYVFVNGNTIKKMSFVNKQY